MKKWILYALVLPCLCKGDIVFTSYNGDLTPAFPSNEFTLDMNNDSAPEFKFSAVMDAPLYSVYVECFESGAVLFPRQLGVISVVAIQKDSLIGSGELGGSARWDTTLGILSHSDLIFPTGSIKGGPFWETNAYLGVSLTINKNTHYGWIQIDNPSAFPGGTITGFAYENTPNTSIIAGAIPEPSSMILFIVGVTGIWSLWKGKREKGSVRLNHYSVF